ncbi:HdeD family acid-resistance protein [Chelatococcus asaccharovorans]|uniref:HdeD family acid-resistance protein n=1 Tax=Chelatococcus asaccharovorans TaxID=28210 RepID=UPI00224C79E1|nr:HdeD family acid-resistance protein [Chelatococcus asaccharovorans]CAH1670300.1 conserved membrane hypothetical protein [Chelatococcus asaccharovorans]CAH1678232.1 conserved membrane hypothetical protein [Chelatococcus asaccharovorans]
MTHAGQTGTSSSLGTAVEEVRGKWGWFVALGVGLILLGVVALANLLLATVATIFYIGAMMLIGGIVEIVHAFQVKTWGRFFYWLLSGIFYAFAGVIAFYNPLLASAALTLLLAVLLVVAGIFRIWIGFAARPESGWGWIVATGVITLLVGVLVYSAWPGNSLVLLGAILAFDLLFQGIGFISFGWTLRSRR